MATPSSGSPGSTAKRKHRIGIGPASPGHLMPINVRLRQRGVPPVSMRAVPPHGREVIERVAWSVPGVTEIRGLPTLSRDARV